MSKNYGHFTTNFKSEQMESIKLGMAQIEGALCMLRRGIPKSALPRHLLLLGVHSSQAF